MSNQYFEQFKLCYVDAETAFFTSGSVADAWGDDWDDAPYQHNAEIPSEPRVMSSAQGEYLPAGEWTPVGVPKWQILRLKYSDLTSDVALPFEGYGQAKSWSVEQINKGDVPWFQVWSHGPAGSQVVDTLNAGATLLQFQSFITRHGGLVWVPIDGLMASVTPRPRPHIPLKEKS